MTNEEILEAAARFEMMSSDDEFRTFRKADLIALAREVERRTLDRYREAGVWEPDGSKFKTYREENLNGKAMFVREEPQS
ncbi:hypothetical protein AWB71_03267 [Caballeronia peredens]|nr:hypothetical protein AWB71_03267 [Caballeronia peredens]